MAARRMFAKSIVQSSRFLKMPASSRELYFQLGMSADDDGIVEAWNVMKLTNATEDDLRVLISKGYIRILDNEDMIAYLSDWTTNNLIRSDRKHASIYKDLLLMITDKTAEIEEEIINDNQVATTCQPSDNQCVTEVSIGKVSIGQDSLGEVINSPEPKNDSEPKIKYADVLEIPLNDGTEWKMPLELFKEYEMAYPALDIKQEISKMRIWCLSNPANKKTKRGVTRFINGWLERSQNSASRKKTDTKSNWDDIK